MTSPKVNKTIISADAVLSDWDGHIALMEQPDLSTIPPYNGNSPNGKNKSNNPNENKESHGDKQNGYDGRREKSHSECSSDSSDTSVQSMSLQSDEEKSTDSNGPQCSTKPLTYTNLSSSTSDGRETLAISTVLGRHASTDGISRPPLSRGGSFYQPLTMGSSIVAVSLTEILNEDYQNEPTSAILDYCKRTFLRPYMIILSLVGLNPISTDTTKCRSFLSYFQCLSLVVVLIFGYFLQYLSSYRGDRGFSTNLKSLHLTAENASLAEQPDINSNQTIGELIFGYVIPFLLDLAGYVSCIICCKFIDQEQLQNLIERTFLMSMQPKRLCRMLWLHIALAFIIFGCLYAYVVPVVVMQPTIIKVKWLSHMETDLGLSVKILLLLTIAAQDIIEIIVLSSYCIECYLLKIHLMTLSQKLLLHSIDSLDWMREILEFRKLLDRLNNHVSIPVCFFIVMNLAYAFAGFIFMFKDFDFHYSALKIVILNFINVVLWLLLGLMPFFMASSLTHACQTVKGNGHFLRVRPFLYHNTSTDDLNSMLMFASTLDMSAKLFRMPIQSNYLCFAILVLSIVVLTMGMCFNLSLLGMF
ncbi:gustatory receptor-like Holozoa isoform X1 [Musca autumnalis]|uniref:gustatory receptor-like Holozoa isoform X1 n=1 Tax=Musca autumnalis TaxID=221902 RepID=UPI003CF09709